MSPKLNGKKPKSRLVINVFSGGDFYQRQENASRCVVEKGADIAIAEGVPARVFCSPRYLEQLEYIFDTKAVNVNHGQVYALTTGGLGAAKSVHFISCWIRSRVNCVD